MARLFFCFRIHSSYKGGDLYVDFASRFRLTLLLCRCYRPGTWGARLLNCWTFGTVLLMAWNLLPLPHVGINPISSLLTGALGISGLPLTVFLNMMP